MGVPAKDENGRMRMDGTNSVEDQGPYATCQTGILNKHSCARTFVVGDWHVPARLLDYNQSFSSRECLPGKQEEIRLFGDRFVELYPPISETREEQECNV